MARAPGPERGGGDARLPWLEGDDARARGGGALAALLIAAVVLLVLAGGGAWYVLRARHGAAAVADGAIVRAPAGPYKVRPAHPGGELAEGTGDTSYAVAEGKAAPAMHVGAGGDAGIADVVVAGTSGSASDAPPAVLAGVPVQLGAFASAADAEARWPGLTQRYPDLAPLRHRVVERRADLGSVFGLQAMAPDAAAANALCATLRAGGLNCRVQG